MNQLASTRNHKIFVVEQRGVAYVVRPQGDAAGFGHADIKVEREHVFKLLEAGQCPNLIIDMVDANYFGSEMIGILSRMIGIVRDRNGDHAVVNVSDDMREGIAILKLDDMWNVSEAGPAYRTIARESLFSPVLRHSKAIILVVAAAALIGGVAYAISLIPRAVSKSNYYTLLEIWENYLIQRNKGRADDFANWKKDQLRKLEPLIESLESRANAKEPELQHMLFAGKDYLTRILDPHLAQANAEDIRLFLEEMENARKFLEERYKKDLVAPSRPDRNQPVPKPPAPHDAAPDDPDPEADPKPSADSTPTNGKDDDAPSDDSDEDAPPADDPPTDDDATDA